MTQPTTTGRRGYVTIDRQWLADPNLSDSALRLMLWLESHTDEYLAGMNYTTCAKQLGWSRNRIKRTVEELEQLGLVETEQLGRRHGGTVTRFTLHLDAWTDGPSRTTAMVHGEARAMVHGEAPTISKPKDVGTHSQNLCSSDDERPTLELVVQQHALAVEPDPGPVTFTAWWDRYPRKVSRKDALKAWAKLSQLERQAAFDTIGRHVKLWHLEGRSTSHLPYPASWLRAEAWNDQLAYTPPRAVAGGRDNGVGAIQRRRQENQQ